MSGNRKYLPSSRAGLALPCLTSRHQAARLAMLKNIILLKRDNKTIPGWAIILDNALKILGFSSLENLLISSGYADLQLVKKNLAKLGLISLSALFENYITISNLLSNDDIGPKCFKKKSRRKNNISKGASKKKPITKMVNDSGPNNSSSKKQTHHGDFHNLPDPPADLDLQPPAITKGIGAKSGNLWLIHFYFNTREAFEAEL